MSKFQVGDRVKLSEYGALDMFPEWENVGEGEIEATNGEYLCVRFENHPLKDGSLCYMSDTELAHARLAIGTRVRANTGPTLMGKSGTVVANSGPERYPYKVQFDCLEGNSLDDNNSHGGRWSRDALDVIEEEEDLVVQDIIDSLQDQITVKDAALKLAAFVFNHYSELHLAKGTPEATMKGLTNVGLERMMLNAIEAD